MSKNIRTFIAIKIKPGPVLSDLIDKCRVVFKGEAIKWVEEDNLHLTLKFLGDTSENQVDKIKNTLEKIGSQFFAFSFGLHGMHFFSSKGSPRVLYVGLTEIQELKVIAEELQDTFYGLGFEKEIREFKPHLTLGRIKFLRDKKRFYQFVEGYKNTTFQTVNVSEVVFYQSILNSYAPEYVPLKIVQLNT